MARGIAHRHAVAVTLTATLVLAVALPGKADAATPLGKVAPVSNQLCIPFPGNVAQSASTTANYEVPAPGGVITRWSHRGSDMGTSSQRLQVWRRVPDTAYLTLVGRSAFESFPPGAVDTHPTRIAVGAGDILGLRYGAACTYPGVPGDIAASDEDGAVDPVPGDTKTFVYNGGVLVNVAAVLEPDADGDGFGDETQDGCPTDASRQGPCAPSSPDTSITLLLDAKRKQKVKRVKVEVGCVDEACDVELGGKAVARKKGKKGRRAGAAAKKRKRFNVKPKTTSVAPGETETERVRFKKHKKSVRKMRRLLKRKAFRKKTKAKVKATATDAAGNTDTGRVKVRLRR